MSVVEHILRPEGKASTNGRPPAASGPPPRVATIADLERAGALVRWLWPGWVQIGTLTALASEGGKGKTRFCADLLRRARQRLTWPDGRPMTAPPDAKALWVAADNNHDELVTLTADFGIREAVYLNAWAGDPYGGTTLDEIQDLADLDRRVEQARPLLVVVDTVGSATDRNLSKQEDAKAFYMPLQVLARKYSCAVIALTHLNAGGKFLGRRILEKVRVAIRMDEPDPDDERRRLEVVKSNARRPRPLGLTMGDHGNEYDESPPREPDPEAGEPGKPRKPAGLDGARAWLAEHLKAGPRRVSHTRDAAEQAGVSVGTLYNAVRSMGVEEYEAEDRKWWRLPANDIPW